MTLSTPCSTHLNRTETKRSTDTGDRNDNGGTVNKVTNPSPSVISQNGVEARAEGHGELETETRQGHADGDDEVGRPSVDTPIGDGQVDGKHGNLVFGAVTGVGVKVRVQVEERFGDSKDKEADGDTGGEDHRKVGRRRKLGGLILLAKLDVSILDGNVDKKEKEDTLGTHVQPGEHLWGEAPEELGESEIGTPRVGEEKIRRNTILTRVTWPRHSINCSRAPSGSTARGEKRLCELTRDFL